MLRSAGATPAASRTRPMISLNIGTKTSAPKTFLPLFGVLHVGGTPNVEHLIGGAGRGHHPGDRVFIGSENESAGSIPAGRLAWTARGSDRHVTGTGENGSIGASQFTGDQQSGKARASGAGQIEGADLSRQVESCMQSSSVEFLRVGCADSRETAGCQALCCRVVHPATLQPPSRPSSRRSWPRRVRRVRLRLPSAAVERRERSFRTERFQTRWVLRRVMERRGQTSSARQGRAGQKPYATSISRVTDRSVPLRPYGR